MKLIENLRERVWARNARENGITLRGAANMPVVPTKFGLGFTTLLIIMFVWSINHQLNLGYALVFINGIIAILSAATTVNTLSRLHIRVGDASPVFVGETAYIPIIISEQRGKNRPALTLTNREDETTCDGIDANSTTHLTLKQTAFQRGWQNTDPLELRSSLPLHLFVAWQWIHPQHHHLVYPAPLGEQPLPRQHSQQQGEHLTEGLGNDELTHLVPYQSGDPLSRIAWKQLGRGEMMSKRFAGEGSETVILDYALTQGDHESRLSQLSKWIIEAETNGLDYQLKLPNYQSPTSRGAQHYHRCLQTLAEQP